MASGVAINKAPTRKPTSLAVGYSRENVDGETVYAWPATWKVPSAATSDQQKDRWERLYVSWMLHTTEGAKKDGQTVTYVGRLGGVSDTSDTMPLSLWKITWGSRKGKAARRQDFYPWTDVRVARVQADVFGWNSKGYGPAAGAGYAFKAPRAPEIEGSFDPETNEVAFVITTDPGDDALERHDTRYRAVLKVGGRADRVVRSWTQSAATEIAWSYDLSQLTDQWSLVSTVEVEAYARGIAGDSAHVRRSVVVASPRKPSIKSISSSTKSNASGMVTVKVAVASHTSRVVLERTTGVPDGTNPPASASWSEVAGAVDDGDCTCLYDMVYDASSDPGTHTWYRLRAENCGQIRYSAYVRADCLFRPAPSAANDKCGIVEVAPARTGTSASVTVGWTEDTANDGTELSWSDNKAAWSSTDGPSTAEFDGDGSASEKPWKRKGTFNITGLTSGTTYYLRARRYLGSGDSRTYTPYTSIASFRTESAEDDRCAIASATVESGVDGVGAYVVIGFSEDNDNTGTEIQWTRERSWYNNVKPDSFQFTWKDSTSRTPDWPKSTGVHLRGLTPGETYYLRARRYLESGDNTTYTPWSKTGSVRIASDSAVDDRCAILSATPEADGKGLYVIVGFREDTANTGTEVEWTTDTSWYTTEEPKSHTFTWVDGKSRSEDWPKTTAVHLRGLDPGVAYRIRARRYNDSDLGSTYSPWSSQVKAISAVAPSSATLYAPSWVRRGRDLDVSWEYEGEAEQTAWSIHPADNPKVSLASGTGNRTWATVKGSRLRGYDSVGLFATVSCGAASADSNTVEVTVADVPQCVLAPVGTLTAQPLVLSVTCTTDVAALLVTVESDGVSVSGPDGDRDQLEGDVVWTGLATPAWAGGGTGAYPYSATAELPTGVDLVDGARYRVTVTPRDPDSGMTGTARTRTFAVAWAHQAPAPADGCSVAFDVAERTATVTLATPTGAAGGDSYDLYRQASPSAWERIAEGLPLACTVRDRWATMGDGVDLAYRACVRTADGDEEWVGLPYEAPVTCLRVDFGGNSVELPYNLEYRDAWKKPFESRRHIDGGVSGYWDSGATRTGRFTADVSRLDGQLVSALRSLAAHSGPCLVRVPDGQAFQADVQVALDETYKSGLLGVSLTVTAVALTSDYMPDDADVEEVS